MKTEKWIQERIDQLRIEIGIDMEHRTMLECYNNDMIIERSIIEIVVLERVLSDDNH